MLRWPPGTVPAGERMTADSWVYPALKTLHVVGIVILLGNVTITSFWKVMAERDGRPPLVAFAQAQVIATDWLFTLSGIVLTMVGGYGCAWLGDMDLLRDPWLVEGQLLFLVSGLLWLGVLLPLQLRQARAARGFAPGEPVPDRYWRQSRAWLVWGVVATVPLVAATWVMIAKP